MKNKVVISSILLGLIVLFLCLKAVWAGFVYFATSFLSLFCFYWGAMFIVAYYQEYKLNFSEDFAFYKAQVVNAKNISEEEFEADRKFYVKKFKRSLTRDKVVDMFKILFCLSFAITCIVSMCTGIIR